MMYVMYYPPQIWEKYRDKRRKNNIIIRKFAYFNFFLYFCIGNKFFMEKNMFENRIKEKNYELFLRRLKSLGIDTSKMEADIGDKIKNATYTNTNDFGNAYDGSLLHIILRTLTPMAININDMLPTDVQANKDSLIKVCLLHQLSKAIKFIPNDVAWEIEKRKMLYKFADNLPSLKVGMHSLIMLQRYGITFNEEEAEAMIIIDRNAFDEQAKWFSSPMATAVKQANELTRLILERK